MKLFVNDGKSIEPLTQMSWAKTFQANFIMRRIAEKIPIEGKDYDVAVALDEGHNVSVAISAYTPQGVFWRDYVGKMLKGVQARISESDESKVRQAVMEQLSECIPVEGVDYDVEMTFNAQRTSSVGIKLRAHTPRGELWCDYLSGLLKEGGIK